MGSRGIETVYRGITFRSRLEARWASFFTEQGIHWEYEPFDADGYIPDFALIGPAPILVEIKPLTSTRQMLPVLKDMVRRSYRIWEGDYIVLGMTPEPVDYSEPGSLVHRGHSVAGLMAEDVGPTLPLDQRYAIGPALWNLCYDCAGQLGFFHAEMSWRQRPCGHADGKHSLHPPDLWVVEDWWKKTHDGTRWERRRTSWSPMGNDDDVVDDHDFGYLSVDD